jgi:hypothetical protein
LCADFTIRDDVVGIPEIEIIDFFFRYELVDVDHADAFNCYRFELFRRQLDVLAFLNFVSLNNVCLFDLLSAVLVDLAIANAVTRSLVELMETDFLAFGSCREKCNGTGDEGKARPSRSTRDCLLSGQ